MIYRFKNENKTIEYTEPVTILEAARSLDIMLSSEVCGIKKCGRCKVYLENEDKIVKACEYKPDKDIDIVTYYSEKKHVKEVFNHIKDSEYSGKYYVAVDIGTTNVELRFYNEKHELVCDVVTENPLRRYGSDVMSLISYANTKEKLNHLHKILKGECDKLIHDYISENKIIIKGFTGNTTMMHILCNKDISSLGRSPFTTDYYGGEFIDAHTYIAPIIKSHVGADSLCCLYGIENIFKGINLIVDVGTNSEILLVKGDEVWACSAAAGPAFESSNISCGMKNAKGAVVKATYKGDYYYDVEKIGSGISYRDYRCNQIKGISGSAILDLVEVLNKSNVIDSKGSFIGNKRDYFQLSPHCKDVVVTAQDIRNVILGKAAIATGIISLMREVGIAEDNIDNIFITGDFGIHISVENAISIGLFPNVEVGKYIKVENAALQGLVNMIVNGNVRKDAKNLAKKIKHLDLTSQKEFNDIFVENMKIRKE